MAKHGDQIASVSLIRCSTRRRMEVTEAFLIDLLQPSLNIFGTWDEQDRWKARCQLPDREPEPVPVPLPPPTADDLADLEGEPEAAAEPAISPEFADQRLREWVADRVDPFGVRELVPLAAELGRQRTWLYAKLAAYESEGLLARDRGESGATVWGRAEAVM